MNKFQGVLIKQNGEMEYCNLQQTQQGQLLFYDNFLENVYHTTSSLIREKLTNREENKQHKNYIIISDNLKWESVINTVASTIAGIELAGDVVFYSTIEANDVDLYSGITINDLKYFYNVFSSLT